MVIYVRYRFTNEWFVGGGYGREVGEDLKLDCGCGRCWLNG